jgi:hypothetical protein
MWNELGGRFEENGRGVVLNVAPESVSLDRWETLD